MIDFKDSMANLNINKKQTSMANVTSSMTALDNEQKVAE